MPSVSKPQATLMAMAAHNPAFAKKKKIPMRVARDFNRADKRTGILKKAAGGRAPAQAGMDAKMNYGLGQGKNMFSTMPLMGHALSGTQLGQADNTIRKAGHILARFADGGAVKKPKPTAQQKGPSAKERKEIRALVERGKQDAVSTLRATRDALMQSAPDDPEIALAKISSRLATRNSGAEESGLNNKALYNEYAQILAQLENPEMDEPGQARLMARLTSIEDSLNQAS
jgi:hypothetical protein